MASITSEAVTLPSHVRPTCVYPGGQEQLYCPSAKSTQVALMPQGESEHFPKDRKQQKI